MNTKYKLLLLAGVIFLSFNIAYSQQWLKDADFSTLNRPVNLFDLEKAFNAYYKDKPEPKNEEGKFEDGEREHFARWDWMMRQRTFPTGEFYNTGILYQEFKNYQNSHQDHSKHTANAANWTLLGPSQVPTSVSGNQGGAGRIDCIRFDPLDSNKFWIGAACGGLWKTTDGGNSWSTTTDLLPVIGVCDVAVDPTDTSVMYIATGDKYGYYADGAFWGGTYSCGVMKSIDGGNTWNTTGLSFIQSQNIQVQRLLICPGNHNLLIAATSNGIYRSTDAAATWTNVQPKPTYDLAFNPAFPAQVYAAQDTNVYKSLDTGHTWNSVTQNIGTGGRMSLAVSAADPQAVYALCQSGTFYSSFDNGVTWIDASVPPAGYYGFYDMVLTASPTNVDVVYTGGGGSNSDFEKSTDGGVSWSAPIANYIHVDNHDIKSKPGSGTTVYCTNDGGVFRSYDGGAHWTDLSNGLAIAQFYRLGCSVTNPNIVYCGQQDNGCVKVNGTTFYSVIGADGMECLVDYTNENTAYTSSQYGSISRTNDGGVTFTSANPGATGDWITPYVIDPVTHTTLYAGYGDVYKSTDEGNNWFTISSGLTANLINVLAIARSNPNYIYAGNMGELKLTTDGGATWSDIATGLPLSSAGILYMAVNDTNPNSIWVVLGGYSAGNKVYQSRDAGATWTNISGTLPNVPVDCIVCQRNTNDDLYIGTDFGVFYKNNTMNDWTPFDAGLPHVIVDELEIQYTTSKLRAATYGRGLWESDLTTSSLLLLDASASNILNVSSVECDSSINPIVQIKNWGQDTLLSVDIKYFVDNNTASTFHWTGILLTDSSTTVSLPSIAVTGGNHTFTSYTTNPNNGTDQNAINDTTTFSFNVINTSQITLPLIQGFELTTFPPVNWTISHNIWQRVTSCSGFGNSTACAMMPFWSNASSDSLYTPFISFSNATSPLYLTFDFAHAYYSAQYSDTFAVKISTDCGASWTTLWIQGGTTLGTAPTNTQTEFIPTNTQWRHVSLDISSYIGMPRVQFEFEGLSGYGNDLYLDDINIDFTTGIPANPAIQSMEVFPNPTSGMVTVLLNGNTSKNISISVYDALGQRIINTSRTLNTSTNQFDINLADFARGIYHLQIETNNEVFNKTISLVK